MANANAENSQVKIKKVKIKKSTWRVGELLVVSVKVVVVQCATKDSSHTPVCI